ncbi:zinc-binding dehydrogenase, partial [Neobacillus drentensis]
GFWLIHILKDVKLYKESVIELLNYIGEGKLKLIIGNTFPLDDAKLAHELIEGRQTIGKIVLNP